MPGFIRNENVFTIPHRQTFCAHGSRNHGLAHRHGFENLDTRAATYAEGNDRYRPTGQVRPDILYPAGNVNVVSLGRQLL